MFSESRVQKVSQRAELRRKQKSEKAITRYESRNKIAAIRSIAGGGGATLTVGGIVIFSLVTLWYVWAAFAVVSFVAYGQIFRSRYAAYLTAVTTTHPVLKGRSLHQIESIRDNGFYTEYIGYANVRHEYDYTFEPRLQ